MVQCCDRYLWLKKNLLKKVGFVNATQAEICSKTIPGLEDREQQDTIVLYAKSSHIHVAFY